MEPAKILEKVLESENLPTLPTVASELVRVTGQEETDIGEIANLITKDIALSAKVLKVVNSAYYNFPNQISTIQQAVSILGINAVRSLVLSFSFLNIKKAGFADPFDYELFWQRSMTTAVAAKMMAPHFGDSDPDEAFIAALLQNIGVLVMARTLPEEYARVIGRSPVHGAQVCEAEKEELGLDHLEVGTAIAESWGFPPILVGPIQYHHAPETYTGDNAKVKRFSQLVHLSDVLASIFYDDQPDQFHKEFRKKASRYHLNDAAINRVLEQVDTEIEKTGRFFGVNLENLRSVEEILQEANARLSVLNMTYEQVNRELIEAKVQLQQLAKELEQKNKRLEKLANYDGLTEVYNHRFFQETLARELNRSIRHEKPISLVLADVDYFKKFNDKYGHQAGDFVLKEVCRVMQEQLRKYDTLARYGGEEFVIVLPETDSAAAEAVAEKLRSVIDTTKFERDMDEFRVSMSFGVSFLEPGEKLTNSELIERADKALYQAKKKGRNRVILQTVKKGWFGK